jgi:predicted ATP-grasp superfamily ATP-dependent carboligase
MTVADAEHLRQSSNPAPEPSRGVETAGSPRIPASAQAGRVLVLDTDRRQGIVSVRRLGRRGLEVTAGAASRLNPGARSKYATRRFRYPSPIDDEAGFIDALEAELRTRSYDVLLPLTDATVPAVVRHRDRLERHAAIPFAGYETLVHGLDKKLTVEAAQAVGVPTPRTLALDELDLERVAAEIGYPAVLKPRRSAGRWGVSVCETPDELEAVYDDTRDTYGSLIVQEFIPHGGEAGVYTLYDWSSTLVGVTVQRRVRSNPPSGGPSTLRETIRDDEMVDLATDLLSSLHWKGVAMVEFRIDARTGTPTLMEINPRLWGSLALSVFAGVDFPYYLYQLATTGECDSTPTYRAGVESRWLLGDVGHVLNRDDTWRALREFAQPARKPRNYDVLSITDPGPGVAHVAQLGYHYVRNGLRS